MSRIRLPVFKAKLIDGALEHLLDQPMRNGVDSVNLIEFIFRKSVADLATSNLQCPTYQMCMETCPNEYYR